MKICAFCSFRALKDLVKCRYRIRISVREAAEPPMRQRRAERVRRSRRRRREGQIHVCVIQWSGAAEPRPLEPRKRRTGSIHVKQSQRYFPEYIHEGINVGNSRGARTPPAQGRRNEARARGGGRKKGGEWGRTPRPPARRHTKGRGGRNRFIAPGNPAPAPEASDQRGRLEHWRKGLPLPKYRTSVASSGDYVRGCEAPLRHCGRSEPPAEDEHRLNRGVVLPPKSTEPARERGRLHGLLLLQYQCPTRRPSFPPEAVPAEGAAGLKEDGAQGSGAE